MTKKHYEAIAKEVRSLLAMCDTAHARTVAKLHAYDLADYFATENPKFDRTRFLDACGVDQKTYKGAVCGACKKYATECTCGIETPIMGDFDENGDVRNWGNEKLSQT